MIFGIEISDFLYLATLVAMVVFTSTEEVKKKAPWLHWVFAVCGVVASLLLLTSDTGTATRIYAALNMLTIMLIEGRSLLRHVAIPSNDSPRS